MENKKAQRTTHNIKQLGFSGLRAFSSRISFFLGGQERSPKTQPFHIVKRYHIKRKQEHEFLEFLQNKIPGLEYVNENFRIDEKMYDSSEVV
jgi:BRCT domain type II-containing protein